MPNVCGDAPTITGLEDYRVICGTADTGIPGISPVELQSARERENVVILDVREPYERDICTIAGSLAIPLASLGDRLDELDQSQTIVCYCKMGGRGAAAGQQLKEAGFTRVYNLKGGILAWIDEIEPSLSRY